MKVIIKNKGGNVSFTIGVQTFTLRHVDEDTAEETERIATFYKEMLKTAFDNLGVESEII